jgi:divinyl protochlorophyllide a 8-vinyl-reductase
VAQWVIRLLPPTTGFAMLARAMERHAWTFAGSGRFSWTAADTDGQPRFAIAGCPMCHGLHASAPMCDFYAGTFERLLRVLVAPACEIHEVSCEATGDEACRFDVRELWPAADTVSLLAAPDLG